MDELKWLENWMRSMCNGSWEHCYGVKIGTLDNPGWWVEIDIIDTPLEEKKFEKYSNYVNEEDWIHCKVEDGHYDGGGDLSKLPEILKRFRIWAEEQEDA